MSLPGTVVEKLRGCILYSVDGPYIIVVNKCSETLKVHAIEVKYYITVTRSETTSTELEPQTIRKEITERITVDQTIESNSRLEIYFGPIENIDEVYAIIDYDGSKYKVPLNYEASELGKESKEAK
ncbi:hypothetical protein Pyrde_1060 [Pyrodictium delaneyi]|uniref:Uncharacterized protein n=1 Tax=Pyrodictium delaneyi TaxID=1273541 RepID=A0A0P0N3L1_9CREN|nr:hypothetical protein [Pyrodictium delaneyi]ALL01108.1 hypothetical protein Pyrde_1060 [Pyrodictium delaneyi]OWJ55312.1 hypothetical protein Pdsh_00345 [Pyrodictium delaneyi]